MTRFARRAPSVLFTILAAAPAARSQEAVPQVDLITAPDEAVRSITAHELEEHMRFLASDFMRGRDTASPEIKIAAEYLAANAAAAGAEPMGDRAGGRKSFFARFPLERINPEPEKTELALVYERDGARRAEPVEYGGGYSVLPMFLRTAEIEAPIVFAGHGLIDTGKEIDDYKDLDVRNRVVLVFQGAPEGSGITGGRASAFAKMNLARERGALGLILARRPGDGTTQGGGFQAMRGRGGRGGISLPLANPPMAVIEFEDAARDQLFQMAGLNPETVERGPIDGLKARLSTFATKESIEDHNVVAFFPGTDPEKRKEIVIYSAHYDHVGVNEQGEIFNGSDDNASGTSAILEVAEAFGQGPRPQRSVAFLWVSGEEQGLLGSRWFSNNLTLPPDSKIIANINMDMVSRNADKEISICPSPKHAEYNSLVAASVSACAAEEVVPKFNADEFYGRTDSYNFARKGIPIVFFFSGLHGDYHRPTDDVEKADFQKAARIARVAYRLGWHAANADTTPMKLTAASQ